MNHSADDFKLTHRDLQTIGIYEVINDPLIPILERMPWAPVAFHQTCNRWIARRLQRKLDRVVLRMEQQRAARGRHENNR